MFGLRTECYVDDKVFSVLFSTDNVISSESDASIDFMYAINLPESHTHTHRKKRWK